MALISPIAARKVKGLVSRTVVHTSVPTMAGTKEIGITFGYHPIPTGVDGLSGMMGRYRQENVVSNPRIMKPVAGYDKKSAVEQEGASYGLPKAFFLEQAPESWLAFLDTHNFTTIATPNNTHWPHIRDIFSRSDAGVRFVYCEKPPAHSLADAEEMARTEKKNPGHIDVVAHNRLWTNVNEFRHRVARGDLGRLRHGRLFYLQDWMGWALPLDVWRQFLGVGGEDLPVNQGGIGKGIDIIFHALDLLRYVTGQRVKRVLFANIQEIINQRKEKITTTEDTGPSGPFQKGKKGKEKFRMVPVGGDTRFHGDDIVTAILELEDGSIINLTEGQMLPGEKNHLGLELFGDNATMRFDTDRSDELEFADNSARRIIENRSPNAKGFLKTVAPWIRDGVRMNNLPFGWWTPDRHGEGWKEVHQRGLLLSALKAQLMWHGLLKPEKRSDLFMVQTPIEAMETMRTAKAIYMAAATGKAVDVDYELK